ncbi:MAG: aminopeptidase [Candidatus Methylomirabilales bacterium]
MERDMIERAIDRLYTVNLRIAPGERILVFADEVRPDETVSPADRARREALPALAERIATAGKRWGETRLVCYPAVAFHGAEPPVPVWEAAFGAEPIREMIRHGVLPKLLTKEASETEFEEVMSYLRPLRAEIVDIVIAVANFSTSHTQFRTLVTGAGGARYASMPLFALEMFGGAMGADWRRVASRSEAVAQRLTRAESALVRTPAGTDLHLTLGNRRAHADTGLLWKRGTFGNLPAGEAYIAPVEGSAEGRLIIEQGPSGPLDEPITVIIREGRAGGVEGPGVHADFLARKFRASPLNGNVAELGVGTNDRATNPHNILEAEKILGTLHIAFGDNSSFGGTVRTPFHLDHVLFKPTLTLVHPDGETETLLQDGSLQDPTLLA